MNRTIPMTMRVSPALKEQLKACAEAERVTLSDVVHHAVDLYHRTLQARAVAAAKLYLEAAERAQKERA